MSQTIFIAETDESGEVLWVWKLAAGARSARPIDRRSSPMPELLQGSVHGANPEAVAEWLMAKRLDASERPIL